MASPTNRGLLFGTVANWLAFAAHLAAAFFLTPFVVRCLGAERYGVFGLVEAVLAWMTLFDGGLAACLVRSVARHRSATDSAALNRACATGLALLAAAGAACLLAGLALWPILGPWLAAKLPGHDIEVPAFLALMLLNLALTLPLSLFPSVLDGLERFPLKSAVRVVFLVARVAATVLVLWRWPDLVALAVVLTACNLGEHLVMAVAVWRCLPGLDVSPRRVDRATLGEIGGYSLHAFLALLAGRVAFQSDAVVIGLFLPAAHVAYFLLAARLVEFAKSLLRSATVTLMPAVSKLEAAGDLAGIRAMVAWATSGVLYLVLPIQLGLAIFGHPFLSLWLRDAAYADAGYPVLLVLSAGLSLAVAQSVASRVLYGTGRLRWFSRLALAEAGLNLGLSLALVRPLGILGVAVGTLVPNALFCVLVIALALRTLHFPAGEYARRCLPRPLVAAAILFAVWWPLAGWVATGDGWGRLAAAGAVGSLVYAAAVFALEPVARRAVLVRAAGFGGRLRAVAFRGV
jgi:O-antigen/teichoic acid export membrane protein